MQTLLRYTLGASGRTGKIVDRVPARGRRGTVPASECNIEHTPHDSHRPLMTRINQQTRPHSPLASARATYLGSYDQAKRQTRLPSQTASATAQSRPELRILRSILGTCTAEPHLSGRFLRAESA